MAAYEPERSLRGQVTGSRTDKVTYVFERSGSYDLPALARPWRSLSGQQARTETVPGGAVTVTAAATSSPDQLRLDPIRVAWSLLGSAGLPRRRRRLGPGADLAAALSQAAMMPRRSSKAKTLSATSSGARSTVASRNSGAVGAS